MKQYAITLKYRGKPIKAETTEDAEYLFNELFKIYKEDIWNDCDITATEIKEQEE